jgi:hypothetical protein
MLLVMRIYHDNLVNNLSDLNFNNDLEHMEKPSGMMSDPGSVVSSS